MDSPGAFTNREPRSGQELCRVAASGPQDVDRAVAAARAAFPAWAATPTGFTLLSFCTTPAEDSNYSPAQNSLWF